MISFVKGWDWIYKKRGPEQGLFRASSYDPSWAEVKIPCKNQNDESRLYWAPGREPLWGRLLWAPDQL
ncbi:MAG: hypothetical protein A2527_04875 [Candidatus Lambdaproteobacteria bacterium RIFOXYD2_FULL_50_16]|uniref:Uncharacterized protein n=1 Tax=Candidatus Lambdaproteobacteria bacterium RIFOXYD2_FULL_50_16 TaxID=1817772 RepID=A0A1F6GBF1_9PROT|nr:MAG: hypothetical protein A2527_04875 [Candidatus Lambdaproteobacteria bacterium RIFOXYD2_FULL_50_16]